MAPQRSVKPKAKKPKAKQSLHNPAPSITAQNAWGEIDLGSLNGEDLEFIIKDADIKFGESIYPVWRGIAADGTPFDELTAMVEVPADYDTTKTMTARVTNRFVEPFEGGWGFLSYKVNDALEATPDSKRVFCYLGLRDRGGVSETLPVVQARQTHDRVIETSKLATEGLHLLAPSYGAMQIGDSIELEVRRFTADGDEVMNPASEVHEVTEDTLGMPLQWQVPKAHFIRVHDGRVEFQYTITLGSSGEQVKSPVQVMAVKNSVPTRPILLAAPSVDGFTGAPLDPVKFPNGVTVRVPAHRNIQVGDYVLLYWQRPDRVEPEVRFARMDVSNLKRNETVFQLGAALLVPGDHEVFYQFAREGHALTSHRQVVEFETARNLTVPAVERASTDGGSRQVLLADHAMEGAYVTVPDIPLQPDEQFEVHWDGYGEQGKVITRDYEADNHRKFKIPPSVVAANMHQPGENDSRRFRVFYHIVDKDENRSAPSAAVDLRVQPLAFSSLITCAQIETNGELWQSKVAPDGAMLEVQGVRLWPFAAPGQLFTIAIQDADVLRNRVPVSIVEHGSAWIKQRLLLTVFDGLTDGTKYSVYGEISFDGGDSWHRLAKVLEFIPKKFK
ncbi:hypothetical protein [Pseudomonas monteilii]|uniref:Uncharacterized protein n=1 Tax=Pseudomonas monteilii TaxID=76759 RepID=A0A399M477_9PSED|nr:hypothetical protein [Pseudomonas monteilii]RII76147.1 hypothetical protein D0894_18845 [Pseudomonas monteilii]